MMTLRDGLLLRGGGVVSLVGAGGKTSLMFKLARELSTAGETVLTTTTTKIYIPSPQQSPRVITSESVANILDQAGELLNKYRHITAAFRKMPGKDKLIGFRPELIGELKDAGLFRWIIVEADGAAGRPIKVPAAHEPATPACTELLVGIVGLNGVGRPMTDQWVFRDELFADITGLVHGAVISENAISEILVQENGIFKNTPAGIRCIAFLNQADTSKNLCAGRRITQILTKKKHIGLDRVVIGQTLYEPPILEVFDIAATPVV